MKKPLFALLSGILFCNTTFAGYPVSLTVKNELAEEISFSAKIGSDIPTGFNVSAHQSMFPITMNVIPGAGDEDKQYSAVILWIPDIKPN